MATLECASGLARSADAGRRALVVPSAAWGSLGDLAMMNGTLSALRKLAFGRVDVTLDPPTNDEVAPFDHFIGGPRWFYNGDQLTRSNLLRRLDDYSHVFLIGADCLDGSYSPKSIIRRIDLVAEAIRRGCHGRILGSSFKEEADAQCLEALRAFPIGSEILARDPISHSRMERAIGRPIGQVADVAFLCPADPHNAIALPVLEWIAHQRRDGRRIVALNINALLGRTIEHFAISHRAIVERLIDANVAIVLAPNDARRDQNDEYFLHLATDELLAEASLAFRSLPASNASATKAVLGAVDMLVTSRMHAAILAAGAGRPAMSFAYQAKFEGFYDLLGLDRSSLIFSPADLVKNPASIADQTMAALDQVDTFAAAIQRTAPTVLELAWRNFSLMD